jgi:hypothetical protein
MTRLSDIFRAERCRAPFFAEAERLEELVYHAQGKMPRAEWQTLRRHPLGAPVSQRHAGS